MTRTRSLCFASLVAISGFSCKKTSPTAAPHYEPRFGAQMLPELVRGFRLGVTTEREVRAHFASQPHIEIVETNQSTTAPSLFTRLYWSESTPSSLIARPDLTVPPANRPPNMQPWVVNGESRLDSISFDFIRLPGLPQPVLGAITLRDGSSIQGNPYSAHWCRTILPFVQDLYRRYPAQVMPPQRWLTSEGSGYAFIAGDASGERPLMVECEGGTGSKELRVELDLLRLASNAPVASSGRRWRLRMACVEIDADLTSPSEPGGDYLVQVRVRPQSGSGCVIDTRSRATVDFAPENAESNGTHVEFNQANEGAFTESYLDAGHVYRPRGPTTSVRGRLRVGVCRERTCSIQTHDFALAATTQPGGGTVP